MSALLFSGWAKRRPVMQTNALHADSLYHSVAALAILTVFAYTGYRKQIPELSSLKRKGEHS